MLGALLRLAGVPFVLGLASRCEFGCCFLCLYVEAMACMVAASPYFNFDDCALAASDFRSIVSAWSRFKVAPYSRSFTRTSSLKTPAIICPKIRVGSQEAHQSILNSHLLAKSRNSQSQSSAGWSASCFFAVNPSRLFLQNFIRRHNCNFDLATLSRCNPEVLAFLNFKIRDKLIKFLIHSVILPLI